MTIYTNPRLDLSVLQPILAFPPFGGELGYGTEGDILVRTTADGVDLLNVWREVESIIKEWNSARTALTNVLTYNTTSAADAIPQSRASESFEEASEYGIAEAISTRAKYHLMGYDFRDYDKRSAFTWKFLRDSTVEQVRASLNYILEADNKLTTGTILERLFSPATGQNDGGAPVYGLYNGDQMIPPAYLGAEFAAGHSHYLVSGSDRIDSGDLEDAIRNVTHHGYGTEPTSQLLALMNPAEAEVVSSWRAGRETDVITDPDNPPGIFAKHDYIPSAGAPAYLSPEEIVGQVAPETYNKLKIEGSYGPCWIHQSDFIPAGYFAVVATYGANSPDNPIAFREHPIRQYRGLREIPGV